MSNAKQHAEWLSLIEVSGPFLTLSVLNQSFQFGLDAHESDVYSSVKQAYQEWEDSDAKHIHTAWIRFLLGNVLGYPDEYIGEAQSIPESAVANLEIQGERIRPDLAILDPEDQRKVKLPILTYPRNQKLDAPVAGSSWPASPHSRMQLLLQNTGLQAGFVTNGAQWSLVHVRKGEPTGYATWQTMLLTEEKLLLQAFKGMLGVEATLGAPEGKSLFDLLDKSAQDQEEVTKELGRQVRQAVEVFINAVDRLDQDSGRKLLEGIEPKEVYNGALTVMMRLIFLLCAEERGLMDDRELYVQNYSVGALNDQLREIASGDEQVLEHRHDAWKRLLATFRLVHGGCIHENLNLPAYGGSLFDPAKYPFLEQCHIDNRVSLHLLDALEFLEIKVPGGGRERRRLSFRALGVEQIGHVYEGLLDHTAVRAKEAVVGLTGRETEEAEIALSALEANKDQIAKFFKEQKIKISGNPEVLLQQGPNVLKVAKLRVVCGTDDELYERVLPFLNIIREDSLEHLQVYPRGSIYVAAGSDRRSSGTHYTPVSLTEEVVQYALEPQVYVGPAEGLPRSDWKLKSAKEIVDLKVCDMAMGSGAFLVQACRYLSERLVEAWAIAAEQAQRPIGFSAEGHFFTKRIDGDHHAKIPGTLIETPLGNIAIGELSAELIADNPEERLSQAQRIIADRCLYGVDINPMAVEMAKLSLWLITLRKDRPFTFLDHALRHGDSLLGVTERQLEMFSMDISGQSEALILPWVLEYVEKVRSLRQQIARIPSHDPEAIRRKQRLFDQVRELEKPLKFAADALVACELSEGNARDKAARRAVIQSTLMEVPAGDRLRLTYKELLGRPTFHWELEFPDVFSIGGFDALIGNPPFLGGKRMSRSLGADYRNFITIHIGENVRGESIDLCAYFVAKASKVAARTGHLGLITTNSITEGDTRKVAIEIPTSQGFSVHRAVKSVPWPGEATLEISKIWLSGRSWAGERTLNGQLVKTISPRLEDDEGGDAPFRLASNEGLGYAGSAFIGIGFVMESEQAKSIIEGDVKYAKCIFPLVNGEDMNSSFDQRPTRWIVSFDNWPLGRVGQRLPICGRPIEEVVLGGAKAPKADALPSVTDSWLSADAQARKAWLSTGVVPRDYPSPVACDFPAALTKVELDVWPDRRALGTKNDVSAQGYAKWWWLHGRRAAELYASMLELTRVLARSIVSQHHNLAWMPTNVVFSNAVAVIVSDADAMYAVLQSSIHIAFLELNASKMRTDIRYTPSDCLLTFPLPPLTTQLQLTGERLFAAKASAMRSRNVGLTTLSKLVNSPVETGDCDGIRALQILNDIENLNAYGWNDIELGHGFHETPQGTRFTISPEARKEVLRRLLKLNHERYAAEVAAGLHEKKGKKASTPPGSTPKRGRKPTSSEQSPETGLFSLDDLEN